MRGIYWSNLEYDFNAYNANNQIWDTVSEAYVTEDVANYLRYRIPATKVGNANAADIKAIFVATAPAGAAYYVMRLRGVSLAASSMVWELTEIAAIKEDAALGTADGGLVANAAQVVTQTTAEAIKAGTRLGMVARWMDESGAYFDLTPVDIP